MKQHITVEQVEELIPENKKKIMKAFYSWHPMTWEELTNGKTNVVSQITIGRMIEFLEATFGKGIGIYGYPANMSSIVPNGGYAIKAVPVQDESFVFGTKDGYLSEGQEELCDALWEAVKGILET